MIFLIRLPLTDISKSMLSVPGINLMLYIDPVSHRMPQLLNGKREITFVLQFDRVEYLATLPEIYKRKNYIYKTFHMNNI